jgi:hypothetical protein
MSAGFTIRLTIAGLSKKDGFPGLNWSRYGTERFGAIMWPIALVVMVVMEKRNERGIDQKKESEQGAMFAVQLEHLRRSET